MEEILQEALPQTVWLEFSSNGTMMPKLDLVEAQWHIDRVTSELHESGRKVYNDDLIPHVQSWLKTKWPGRDVSFAEASCVFGRVRNAWAQFKKKFETASTLPESSELTREASMSAPSTFSNSNLVE